MCLEGRFRVLVVEVDVCPVHDGRDPRLHGPEETYQRAGIDIVGTEMTPEARRGGNGRAVGADQPEVPEQ